MQLSNWIKYTVNYNLLDWKQSKNRDKTTMRSTSSKSEFDKKDEWNRQTVDQLMKQNFGIAVEYEWYLTQTEERGAYVRKTTKGKEKDQTEISD